VIGTFLLILPYGLIAALSPMMFTEQTLILASRSGKRYATAYAIGAVLTLLGFAFGLVLFGRAIIELPDNPELTAWLDLAIGAVMLVAAAVIHLRRDRPPRPATNRSMPSGDRLTVAFFAFGVFSMLTNFKAVALMIPAAKAIATRAEILPERVVLTVAIVMIASIPAWLPPALTVIAPGSASRMLDAIKGFLARHGRRLLLALLLLAGTALVVRGAVFLA